MPTKTLSPEEKAARAAARISQRNQAALDQSGANDPRVAKPSRSGGTVTVACKVDLPWIDLQLCEKRIVSENTQTGPRDVTQWFPVGEVVRIRGLAYPTGIAPRGFPKPPEMVAGAALTPNVSADFWNAWLEQHKLDAMVRNGLIFAHASPSYVGDQAKERQGLRSGLQPLEPDDGDRRVVRSIHKDVVGVETDDRMKDSGRHAAT